MSMNRPPAVNALFAGHSLPRTAKALDQIRGHITRLEEVVKLAGVSMELVEDVDDEAHALCERMKTAHNVKRVAKQSEGPCAPWRSDYDPAAVKRGPVILDDDGEV